MKKIILYGGVMLVLASCLFYFYYKAGRFSNTYKELEKSIEEGHKKTAEPNDTVRNAITADTLYEKQNSKGH